VHVTLQHPILWKLMIVMAAVTAGLMGWSAGLHATGTPRSPDREHALAASQRARKALRQHGFEVYEARRPSMLSISAQPQPDLTPPLVDLDVWDPTLVDQLDDTVGAPLRVQYYPSADAARAALARYRRLDEKGYYLASTRCDSIVTLGWVYSTRIQGRLRARIDRAARLVCAAPTTKSEPRGR
jgi:hypothetical protein